MKNKMMISVAVIGVALIAGCKKDELSPRQNGYIIQYNFEAPTFLTDQEREILDAKRSEWENL